MRQANWDEMFAPRHFEPMVITPDVPEEPQGWRRLVWWEDLLTFGLLSIAFFAVVISIDRASWVAEMPALLPVAFFGLMLGFLLSRLRWHEGFLHLIALPLGAAAALGQILLVIDGPDAVERFQELTNRMGAWFHEAFTGGASSDELPFIVLVVPLTWLSAYLSSWAIFRWRNAMLGLVPGGGALLLNIAFQPGQFSFAFVVYVFAGALLVTRMHLMAEARRWRSDATPFPAFLSLSVLHATFWLALLLIGVAWLLPQADKGGIVEAAWNKATAPAREQITEASRLFLGVEPKQGTRVHSFDDLQRFLGDLTLPDALALLAEAERFDQPQYLRAAAYDEYSEVGWRTGKGDLTVLQANEITTSDSLLLEREPVVVTILSTGRTGDSILFIGQPRRTDRTTVVHEGGANQDVISVESSRSIREGSDYESVGTVSSATEDELRAAGEDYPDWTERYQQLPDDFSTRVAGLADELTASEANAYDSARAIESYLRNIPYALDVPDAPAGTDPIEHFLFEAQRGYFDYHASAMVVMLRSQGIPARFAVGYVLDPDDYEDGQYRVSEQNAFAWPEVYFPDYGWVEFNPTPSQPTIVREGDPSAASEGATPGEGLEGLPGGPLAGGFGTTEDTSAGDTFAPLAQESSNRAQWVLIGIASAVAAMAVAGAGGLAFAWQRGMGALDPASRRWGQTVRLASWARLAPETGATPREYARALRERDPQLSGAEEIADAYVRQRYGRERLSDAERGRVDEAWRNVRRALLRRFVPWREPPSNWAAALDSQKRAEQHLDSRPPRI